ncbi:hypothetical protein HY932_00015 [Candidatus Falkowbacteria bacterium]|nr:hypothetical protein [Candidatus Falkowbacteria bacterium]
MTNELSSAIKIVKRTNKKLFAEYHQRAKFSVHFKAHKELVSNDDITTNKFIIDFLQKKFPTYDIISEEAKKIDKPGTITWYVDPIDGTTNFIYGFTEFAVCVGLEDRGDIKIGVVGLPMTKEIYHAQENGAAWCDKKRVTVSKRDNLQDAMVLFCPGHSPEGRHKFNNFIQNKLEELSHWRYLASAGVELTHVASGKADACFICDVKPWDVVAGIAIIRSAGGKVTNFQGNDWTVRDTTFVASNSVLHDKILGLVKDL